MAGEQGFEPWMLESKSSALDQLGDSPIIILAVLRKIEFRYHPGQGCVIAIIRQDLNAGGE